jgi:hypothetical protein
MSDRVVVTIQAERGAAAQQAALRDWLATQADLSYQDREQPVAAVIAEGVFTALSAPAGVVIEQIAAGCVCCVGQIALRVTLTRVLRKHRPTTLLLLLASGEHIDRVRRMLQEDHFATVLRLSESVHDAGSR